MANSPRRTRASPHCAGAHDLVRRHGHHPPPDSKCDIDGSGVDVRLYRNGTTTCPYDRLRSVFDSAADTSPDAPLFQHATGASAGTAVSYSFMLAWVKDIMVRLGVPADRVGLQSFRIGGATSLAMLGVAPHIIKIFGRWESVCYQLYTLTSTATLRETMLATATSTSTHLFGGLDNATAFTISDDALDSLPRLRVNAPRPSRAAARRRGSTP